MTARRTLLIAAASFWCLFGVIQGIEVWISMITHGHSVPLLLTYYILVWEAWFGVTVLVVWLVRRFPVVPPKRLNVLVHILAACVVAVLHGIYWLGLLLAMKPFDRMTADFDDLNIARVLFGRLCLEWILYALVLGCALAAEYYERYRQHAVQAAQLEASLADARMRALELQIQPHFLFNTMNAISALVRTNRNAEAVEMMAGLSELLRYTLDHAGNQRVPLEDEVAVLRRYLEIQRARFPDRMSFCIEVSAEARAAAVPTLLLQPLAENAVRHGIAVRASEGLIEVRAHRRGELLSITMFNTGSLAHDAEHGIGLRNTIERLRHLYGDAARFELTNGNGGVTASVSIPWSEVA